jgi:hypothetical protein
MAAAQPGRAQLAQAATDPVTSTILASIMRTTLSHRLSVLIGHC